MAEQALDHTEHSASPASRTLIERFFPRNLFSPVENMIKEKENVNSLDELIVEIKRLAAKKDDFGDILNKLAEKIDEGGLFFTNTLDDARVYDVNIESQQIDSDALGAILSSIKNEDLLIKLHELPSASNVSLYHFAIKIPKEWVTSHEVTDRDKTYVARSPVLAARMRQALAKKTGAAPTKDIESNNFPIPSLSKKIEEATANMDIELHRKIMRNLYMKIYKGAYDSPASSKEVLLTVNIKLSPEESEELEFQDFRGEVAKLSLDGVKSLSVINLSKLSSSKLLNLVFTIKLGDDSEASV